jgi:hypothetical protein
MKTKTLLVSFLLFILIGNNLMSQNFDFRNVNWGADSAQIKNNETGKMISSRNNSLQFIGKLGDWDVRILYYYGTDNQLWRAAYVLKLGDKDPQAYVNAFLMIQSILTNKYKDPYSKVTSTINGKVITQDEWATNLISDNLNLETRWKNDKTNIVLTLFSINDDLTIEINYNSIAADKKHNDEKRQELLKDL